MVWLALYTDVMRLNIKGFVTIIMDYLCRQNTENTLKARCQSWSFVRWRPEQQTLSSFPRETAAAKKKDERCYRPPPSVLYQNDTKLLRNKRAWSFWFAPEPSVVIIHRVFDERQEMNNQNIAVVHACGVWKRHPWPRGIVWICE